MKHQRKQDEVSEYKILVGSRDCHIDRAARKCTIIDGSLRAIDEFFAQFGAMEDEQRKRSSPEFRDFYARLFYSDGLVGDLMLRKHTQEIDGKTYDAINVARVGVRRPNQKGRGTLKAILDHIEKRADERGWISICENVRGALASHLANRGYIPFTAHESCNGISASFRNTWVKLPTHRAAIINLPEDIFVALQPIPFPNAKQAMDKIMAEEIKHMFSAIRARYEAEVKPVSETEAHESKLMWAKRKELSVSSN